jgi:hypothetical protein
MKRLGETEAVQAVVEFSNKAMLECAARELVMRRACYPRWVREGKMSQTDADYQIAVQAAIVEVFREKLKAPDLFAGRCPHCGGTL